ncbi:MAG: hypothetical protein V1742_05355, partial [Pseudomonadota bacterium]
VVKDFCPRVTGAIQIVLEKQPPVVEPPLPVKIEYAPETPVETLGPLAAEIEDKIHTFLRFRAKVEMVPRGTFEGTEGATFKASIFDKRYQKKA